MYIIENIYIYVYNIYIYVCIYCMHECTKIIGNMSDFCMQVRVYMYRHEPLFVCARVYVYTYIYICVSARIHVHTHTYLRICKQFSCACKSKYVYIHTRKHIQMLWPILVPLQIENDFRHSRRLRMNMRNALSHVWVRDNLSSSW